MSPLECILIFIRYKTSDRCSTLLKKMNIDPKLVEFTADGVRVILYNIGRSIDHVNAAFKSNPHVIYI